MYKYWVVGFFGGFGQGIIADVLTADENVPASEDIKRWKSELEETEKNMNHYGFASVVIVNWKLLREDTWKETTNV